jgi:hypothetical protein
MVISFFTKVACTESKNGHNDFLLFVYAHSAVSETASCRILALTIFMVVNGQRMA